MSGYYFGIYLRFAFGFICYFCFDIQSEPINLIEKAGGPVMLVTSEQTAKIKDPNTSAKKALKVAQQLCLKIGKKFRSYGIFHTVKSN